MYKDIEVEAEKWDEISELLEQANEDFFNYLVESGEEFHIFTESDNDDLPF